MTTNTTLTERVRELQIIANVGFPSEILPFHDEDEPVEPETPITTQQLAEQALRMARSYDPEQPYR